jgi:hypothetical protein
MNITIGISTQIKVMMKFFKRTICGLAICIVMQTSAFGVVSYQADHIPWSGYWWPYSNGGLSTGSDYRGHPAPLEKYHLLRDGKMTGDALEWYNERYYNPEAPAWHGLCGDWARAACYENIVFYPSSENNIIFRVGDKKGLLTLAHNSDLSEREAGSRPDVFHRWLLSYIRDQRLPFMFDLDPGEEGWSYALYRYDMQSTVQLGRESVTVTIYFADDFVHPDIMGTQTQIKTYTYDLIVDGNGRITGGQWTGSSVDDHPDGLTFPVVIGNQCPGLDYDEVLRISKSRDDYLENGVTPVDIGPGTYNLILMDEDIYRIGCGTGDEVTLSIQKQNGSAENIHVIVKDSLGQEIRVQDVGTKTPFNMRLTAVHPPYFVSLSQTDYTDPNIYTLILDQHKYFIQDISYIPKNGYWSGFALTNYGDQAVSNVTLSAYQKEGAPIQTLLGPSTLASGEKKIFLFENLPWRRHEYNTIDHLVLMAGDTIGHLNMVGLAARNVTATQVQGASMGKRLVLPETSSSYSYDKKVLGSIHNSNLAEVATNLKLYQNNGSLQKEARRVLSPREKLDIGAGNDPFDEMPDDGWIEVVSETDEEISGYQYITESGGAEGIFALPVTNGSKYIPLIPPENGYWKCWAVLINPNDDYNTVRMHSAKAGNNTAGDIEITLSPNEKRTVQLQGPFGAREGDPLFRSVLLLSGTRPFVGYYAYRPTDQKDMAYFPMISVDELKTELILPHNAGKNGYWWTAACVFNPGDIPLEVWVRPYSESGELFLNRVSKIRLQAGESMSIQMQQFFGNTAASEISYVKFVVDGEGGDIGGFVLYGSISPGMVAGYNM